MECDVRSHLQKRPAKRLSARGMFEAWRALRIEGNGCSELAPTLVTHGNALLKVSSKWFMCAL